MKPTRKQPQYWGRITGLLVCAIGLTGLVLVLLSTSRYGVAVSSDSAHYLSAARSLLAGKGYVIYDGSLFTHWPPLFPTFLAFLGLFGLNPLDGARYANALAFSFIIFSSYLLFRRHLRENGFALFGCSLVLLSYPVLTVCSFAWSEPFFLFFVLTFLLCLDNYLDRSTTPLLLCLSVIVSLACLQRYIGIALVFTALISILWLSRNGSFIDRFKHATIFCLIAVVPTALWIMRNVVLSETLAGDRKPSYLSLQANIFLLLDELTLWPLPDFLSFNSRLACFALGAILVPPGMILARRRNPAEMQHLCRVAPIAIFTILYVFLLLLLSRYYSDINPWRLLAPIYVPVMCLVLMVLEDTYRYAGHFLKSRIAAGLIAIGIAGVWLVPTVNVAFHAVSTRIRFGVGGFSTSVWMDSDFVKWIKRHPLRGDIYANNPETMYLLTGLNAKPFHRLTEASRSNTDGYLLWCGIMQKTVPDMKELSLSFKVEPVVILPDGEVYAFRTKRASARPGP